MTATTLAKTADFKQDLFMVRARELASITCHTQHKSWPPSGDSDPDEDYPRLLGSSSEP
jgi:hypothetical protein